MVSVSVPLPAWAMTRNLPPASIVSFSRPGPLSVILPAVGLNSWLLNVILLHC